MNYDDDGYSQDYGQIKEAFRVLTKDDMLRPYLSDHGFRSSNEGNDVGYKLSLFGKRYQKNLETA